MHMSFRELFKIGMKSYDFNNSETILKYTKKYLVYYRYLPNRYLPISISTYISCLDPVNYYWNNWTYVRDKIFSVCLLCNTLNTSWPWRISLYITFPASLFVYLYTRIATIRDTDNQTRVGSQRREPLRVSLLLYVIIPREAIAISTKKKYNCSLYA